MNNLQLINENFHASNLSKYQYTISLINECVRCEILPKAFLYNVQIKISEILKDLIMRYTKGESTSVTVEKAEKLIIGIWYTIDAYMKTFENLEIAIDTLKKEEISYIYERGKGVLKEDFKITEKLYEKTLKNQICTDLMAYNTTLSGIENFFKYYDLEFEPDENAADIDYPLIFDDWDMVGLYYMKNYLWNLYVENEICNKFDNKDIHKILKTYGDIYKIDYRDLLINIFEMTINNAVFSILCNSNSLEIEKEEFEKLNNNLKKITTEEVRELIEEIISSDNIYEKITLINKKINSIKDYVDMLKSDCLFEDEYMMLYMSLSNLELSFLGKYVFYGEYRIEDIDLKKYLRKKINTTNEWEKFYIEYLKSLSESKLKEIENLINGKL